MKKFAFPLLAALLCFSCVSNEISVEEMDGYTLVHQTKGPDLGYDENSGVTIIMEDGFAFKDLDKDGELDVYEDWRKPVRERAEDLASQLPTERICGLMLYFADWRKLYNFATPNKLILLCQRSLYQ